MQLRRLVKQLFSTLTFLEQQCWITDRLNAKILTLQLCKGALSTSRLHKVDFDSRGSRPSRTVLGCHSRQYVQRAVKAAQNRHLEGGARRSATWG